MMLWHEVFDPETSKKVLVDHAFMVAGGRNHKASNWLGAKLDASKRSQVMFMDRENILICPSLTTYRFLLLRARRNSKRLGMTLHFGVDLEPFSLRTTSCADASPQNQHFHHWS